MPTTKGRVRILTQSVCSHILVIKNVSSSTSHKKNSVFTSFCLSLREFKKILPKTFIYELIMIKNYINANIMNT